MENNNTINLMQWINNNYENLSSLNMVHAISLRNNVNHAEYKAEKQKAERKLVAMPDFTPKSKRKA